MLCDSCRKHFKQPDLIKYKDQYLCMKCLGDTIGGENKQKMESKIVKFFNYLYDKLLFLVLKFYYKL